LLLPCLPPLVVPPDLPVRGGGFSPQGPRGGTRPPRAVGATASPGERRGNAVRGDGARGGVDGVLSGGGRASRHPGVVWGSRGGKGRGGEGWRRPRERRRWSRGCPGSARASVGVDDQETGANPLAAATENIELDVAMVFVV
jgi:hypothetical protein